MTGTNQFSDPLYKYPLLSAVTFFALQITQLEDVNVNGVYSNVN